MEDTLNLILKILALVGIGVALVQAGLLLAIKRLKARARPQD